MRLDSAREETITNLGGSRKFTMTASPKAFQILSSGIYERKIEAIVRELSCNAYDSHVVAGKVDVPFEVTLPTAFNTQFSVEDFGVGLSEEEVYEVYTTYFASTKTQSNDVIGALGLGSKTPFSYTDSFTIVARKDGKECTFTASIGQSGEPEVVKLYERPWLGESGVKVTVEVSSRDTVEFISCAKKVFGWFSVKPLMNRKIECDISEEILSNVLEYGFHLESRDRVSYRSEFKVLMGNVAYSLDLDSLKGSGSNAYLDSFIDELTSNKSDLYFSVAIGDADVAASRETLSLDDKTKENLRDRIKYIQTKLAENTEKKLVKMNSVFDAHFNLTSMERKLVKDIPVNNGHTLTQLNQRRHLSTSFDPITQVTLFEISASYDMGFYGDFSGTGRVVGRRSKRLTSAYFEGLTNLDVDTGNRLVTVVINDCPRKIGIKGAVKDNTDLPAKVLVVCDKNTTLTTDLEMLISHITFGAYKIVYASSFWDSKLSANKSTSAGLADETVRANILEARYSLFAYKRKDLSSEDKSRWAYARYDGCNDVRVLGKDSTGTLVFRVGLRTIISEFDLDGIVAYNGSNEAKIKRILPTSLDDLIKSKVTEQDYKNYIMKDHLKRSDKAAFRISDGYQEFYDSIVNLPVNYCGVCELFAETMLPYSERQNIIKSIDNRLEVFQTTVSILKEQNVITRAVLATLSKSDNDCLEQLKDYLDYLKQRKEK